MASDRKPIEGKLEGRRTMHGRQSTTTCPAEGEDEDEDEDERRWKISSGS